MKECINCFIKKELIYFYKHKEMKDGRLNKCIECCKIQERIRVEKLKENKNYIEKERKRGREKYNRLYVGLGKSNKQRNERYFTKYPEKKKAQLKSHSLIKPFEGAEKHHWSYNQEHYKDVIWLIKKHHMKAHRFIIYDQEQMMYRRYDNNILLNTKQLHQDFINHCINNLDD